MLKVCLYPGLRFIKFCPASFCKQFPNNWSLVWIPQLVCKLYFSWAKPCTAWPQLACTTTWLKTLHKLYQAMPHWHSLATRPSICFSQGYVSVVRLKEETYKSFAISWSGKSLTTTTAVLNDKHIYIKEYYVQ